MDLQTVLRWREGRFSLRTKDLREARHLARRPSADFERLRKILRERQGDNRSVVLVDALIQDICAVWRHHAPAGDEHGRREGLFAEESDERAAERRETREHLTGALQRSRYDAATFGYLNLRHSPEHAGASRLKPGPAPPIGGAGMGPGPAGLGARSVDTVIRESTG